MFNILSDSFIKSSYSSNDDIDYEFKDEDYLRLYFIKKDINIVPEKEPDNKDNEPIKESKTIEKTNKIQHADVSMNCTDITVIKKKEGNRNSNANIKKLIFSITKVKKKNTKKGRLDKKSKKKYYVKHSKFTQDNIIKKIKASFIEKSMNYINREYELYMNKHQYKKIKKLIQRISPAKSKEITIKKNLLWFQSKLKDVFSSNLSTKCILYEPDYNKNTIDELYKNNMAKNVIDILNKSVKEMYYIYSQDIEIDGFKTLKDDLINLREKMKNYNEENIEEYLENYKKTAQNLEKIFIEKNRKILKNNKSIKKE